jgi:hypothetical protein
LNPATIYFYFKNEKVRWQMMPSIFFGGYGYIVENQIEHFYRDARMLSVFGELGQTQKNLIADRMIGKI